MPGNIKLNWCETINEISRDEEIVDYLKTKVTYKMVLRCYSPNSLTFEHDGSRPPGVILIAV